LLGTLEIKPVRKLLLAFFLAAAAAALSGCPNSPGGGGGGSEILLGHYASLSGATAMFGQMTDKGCQLAVEEINEAGGVLGKQIKLETLDDVSREDQVQSIVERLINNGAVTLIGEVASKRSIAAAPIADAQGVPMISSASTNPKVTVDARTGVRKYVFRVCFTDPFQGSVIAKFVSEHLKGKNAAILYDSKEDYSVGLRDGFRATWEQIGGKVAREEAYQGGDKDFRSQLTSIKAANPDALVVPGYYGDINLIVKQARGLGLNIPIVGGDGWDSPTLADGAAAQFKDCYFSNHFSPEEERTGIKEFVDAFKAKFNEEPNALAALGYDAVKLAADAIKRANSAEPKAVRDAIEQTKDFQGVTGTISIDPEHNAVKSAVVVKVEGKKFPLVTVIKPE
jgi:branched-chain amino acid transport system substrate-binding protein